LYPFDETLFDEFLETFDAGLADAADHEYLDEVDPFEQLFALGFVAVGDELHHEVFDFLEDEMFVEVLFVDDVQFVDYYCEFYLLVQQALEDVLLEAAGKIEYVNEVKVDGGYCFVFGEDLIQDHLLIIERQFFR
jgi:hypothetical protein